MRRFAARIPTLLAALSLSAAPVAHAAGVVEERVSFETHDGLVLEGILSYPDSGDGPFPGMLMISGSGLNDADVTVFAPFFDLTDGRQKIFRNLARTFSKGGFTVLRYNKRGATFDHVDDNPALLDDATVGDLIEDARGALATLLAHPRTAATPRLILGHSEGTYVATRLARDAGQIDLLVLIGSVAGRFEATLRYQIVDRYMDFYELAVDADRDGFLTLDEFGALDGESGLGSFWVFNDSALLFDLLFDAGGSPQVNGLNPALDLDGDGRLDLAGELRPAKDQRVDELIDQWKSGAEGAYMQSYFSLPPNLKQIRKTGAEILFVQGEADVQTPVSETVDLIAKLERRPAREYDLLLLPGLGHTLSPPNDYFKGDGGLTVLDNPTLNAPSRKTIRKILRRVRSLLRSRS